MHIITRSYSLKLNVAVAAIIILVVSALSFAVSANAQQITSIPSGMHKCLGFVLSMNSLSSGTKSAVGGNVTMSNTDKELAQIEGCILHWDRLYPNG